MLAACLDADMARRGLRLSRDLGTPRLSYHQVFWHLQAPPAGSEVARHHRPDRFWSDTEHLLAAIVDNLAIANWQRAGKGPKPKPVPRPGTVPTATDDGTEVKNEGVAAPVDDITDMMADLWQLNDPEPLDPAPDTAATPRQRAVAEYREGGVTYAILADRYGVSASTIGRWVRAATQ